MSKPYNKEDYRKLIAEEFLNCLNVDGDNWKAGWKSTLAPINGIYSKKYRGINSFYLSLVAMKNGYEDNRWFTLNQIIDKDGNYHKGEKWHLEKGSKAVYVEFWMPFDIQAKKPVSWKEYNQLLLSGRDDKEFGLVTRYYPVFNGSKIEGLPPLEKSELQGGECAENVERIREGMGVEVFNDGGDSAYYEVKSDSIHLPAKENFIDSYQYNATLLHELSHASGSENRLDRERGSRFGDEKYAYEELVAEISSCFLNVNVDPSMLQSHIDNHKAYVSSWVSAIKDNPTVLSAAINDAENAANFMEYCGGFISREEYERLGGKVEIVTIAPEVERAR